MKCSFCNMDLSLLSPEERFVMGELCQKGYQVYACALHARMFRNVQKLLVNLVTNLNTGVDNG